MLEIFKKTKEIEVFMSEKKDGNMKLFSTDFEIRRKKYLNKKGLEYGKLVSAKLEHQNKVAIIENLENKFVNYTDGLLTNNPEVILSVTVADCLPVFLFNPVKKVVGVLHCGWRGVAWGIIETALSKMKNNFKSDLQNVLVGIGPGIQSCHFKVEADLIENFAGCEKFIIVRNGKKYLDLKGIIIEKLILNGIDSNNIEVDERCSCCDNDMWSYRRDGEGVDGIQAMLVGIKLVE